MNKLEALYVVHAPFGYEEHGHRVSALLAEHYLNFEFVNEESLPNVDEVIDKYFCKDTKSRLSKGALLCTLSHILCYKKIADNKNWLALILEDDPYFMGGFNKRLQEVIDEASNLPPGFIISLENSTLKFPPYRITKRGKLVYPAHEGRCAGAYLIDLKGAQDILASIEVDKCDEVIDLWHNKLVRNNTIKIYWAHPPLVEQCSLNGMMNAGISSRANGFIRRISWIAQKIYKTHFLRLVK